LEGAQVEIGRPIAPGCANFFAQTTPSSEDARLRIYTALIDACDEVHDVDAVPFPSGPLMWLAAAAHNLCALTDPALDRVFVRGARDTVLRWIDRWIELIPPPVTRGDALSRHALLGPLLSLKRTDTVVKNWAYTYRFFGRRPPANVVALPAIRFVRTAESEVGLSDLFARQGGLSLDARHQKLVCRSPVTELLAIGDGGAFQFSIATLTVLADVGLRSGIAKQLSGKEGAGGVVAAALRAPELVGNSEFLRIALGLVLDLHMISALDADAPAAGARGDAGILFDALLVAAFEDDQAIETLKTLDDGDRARLQARAERARGTQTDAAAREAARLYAAARG
jgi:hypothetical protein